MSDDDDDDDDDVVQRALLHVAVYRKTHHEYGLERPALYIFRKGFGK